ncbi:hypothetical protein [Streptomyces sp. AC1-42T]|uniref:hypothetical protein n=1 Tax=Streptomyces sp. AC1-42T TaxID=2218665 RepID=UPI000DADC97D|nr:hypothetical protein [Streptomyces sp. AC1-42T]PZT71492.1 hypothetical protein DNK55_32795 [Streptomyces sp. AC1-42T]
MTRPDAIWGALLLTGAAYELFAIKNRLAGDTLSERLREWLRTRTRPGRAVFLTAWLALAIWFPLHITDVL